MAMNETSPGFSGVVAINVGCEFRDRGLIPSVCQITDADQGNLNHSLNGNFFLD